MGGGSRAALLALAKVLLLARPQKAKAATELEALRQLGLSLDCEGGGCMLATRMRHNGLAEDLAESLLPALVSLARSVA